MAARFSRPVLVVPQVIRAPDPLNTPPVLVQEVAARLTKPVSDTGQAVVLVDTLTGETTMPVAQLLTFEVTLDEMLPPAKLLVVVDICVRPPVETEDVMVGAPDDAIMVM